LDEGVEKGLSAPKGRILDEPKDASRKKLKQVAEKINGNNQEDNVLSIKSIPASIYPIRSFSRLIAQEGPKRMDSFQAYHDPSDLKKYALLNTLEFPTNQGWNTLPFFERTDGPRLSSRLEFLIQEMINLYGKGSKEKETINAKILLEEILFRNSAFLIPFISSERESIGALKHSDASGDEINELSIREEMKLLEWLMNEFPTQASFPSQSEDLNGKRYSASSLHNIVSDYFQANLDSAEKQKNRWRKRSRRKTVNNVYAYKMVNEKKAIITKSALHVLGTYYKSKNPTQWKNLFPYDSHFVVFFAIIKQHEQNGNLNRFYQHFPTWNASKLFPWVKSKASPEDPETYDGNGSIKEIQKKIKRFEWTAIETYFENVNHNAQDESVPENLQVHP
jgi:hypothetical protein